jgi:magnesium transporter
MTALPKANGRNGESLEPLVYVGDTSPVPLSIEVICYNESTFTAQTLTALPSCPHLHDEHTVTWVNITGLARVDVFEQLGQCFGLHPLVLEDMLNTTQRPKVEDYGDYLYMVIKDLEQGPQMGEIAADQVSLVLGPQFVISVQERPGDSFDAVRERLRTSKGRLRKLGADYLAYALFDAIVDNYFTLVERLGDQVDLLQDTLVSNPSPDTLQMLHRVKREMIFFRSAIWPLREVIGNLERWDIRLISANTVVYLRDVYDHTIQVIDALETLRDILSTMLDIYLSSLSNRMNQIMKVLTVISTLFIPLTFLVGVYGMNFRHMPELDWPWAYPLLWGLMLMLVGGMLYYFRRQKWL